MRLFVVLFVSLTLCAWSDGLRGPFSRFFPKRRPAEVKVDDDPGEPLFLTPYLEQGKVEEARRLR